MLLSSVFFSLKNDKRGASFFCVATRSEMVLTVTKRNGTVEDYDSAKLLDLLQYLTDEGMAVDLSLVCRQVRRGMVDGMTTSDLNDFVSSTVVGLSTQHPDYSRLAGRVAVRGLHKTTRQSILSVESHLEASLCEFVKEHCSRIDSELDGRRDFGYDYFAFKTMEKSYLLRDGNTGGACWKLLR